MNRREAIQNGLLGLAAVQTTTMSGALAACEDKTNSAKNMSTKAPFRHSVCKWCYGKMPLEGMAEQVKGIGITSIELLGVDEWPILKKYGLTCAMGTASWISLTSGFNDPNNHAKLQSMYPELLKKAADAGIPNVICFSGNRNGKGEQEGLDNCARGLEKLAKEAEKAGVNLVMELLNSKVDHKDYQCDHTEWGVVLCEMVGSDNFKLLYDIYHMQIMEGNVIANIKKYAPYISHYHTGGVPGRHEINDSQELYYPAIMKAIVETGYKGFVGQEFIPAKADKLASLKEGVTICDV